jgi:hypothetical protein
LDCVAETVIARLPNPSRTAIFSGADRVHGLLSTQTMLKRIGFVSGLVIALGVTVGGSQNSSALANYRVPAGTVLQARLRTPLGSASSRVDDQVDAILLEPVNGDGVELIPVSQRELRGRLSLAFFVVQHAQTGSRAAIVSRPIKFEASEPEEPVTKGRRQKKYPVDVQTSPAQLVSVTLAEPLTVFLPK